MWATNPVQQGPSHSLEDISQTALPYGHSTVQYCIHLNILLSALYSTCGLLLQTFLREDILFLMIAMVTEIAIKMTVTKVDFWTHNFRAFSSAWAAKSQYWVPEVIRLFALVPRWNMYVLFERFRWDETNTYNICIGRSTCLNVSIKIKDWRNLPCAVVQWHRSWKDSRETGRGWARQPELEIGSNLPVDGWMDAHFSPWAWTLSKDYS